MALRADAARYGRWRGDAGFWAVASYRLRRTRKLGPWYCRALLPADLLLGLMRRCMTSCRFAAGLRIGPGFYLAHPDGVIINPTSRVGSDVAIYQQVTLGEWQGGAPSIRSHVSIYAGAKIVGKVTVGQRAFVGANAVVAHDVPPWHTATGVPAKHALRKDFDQHAKGFKHLRDAAGD